MHPLQVLLLHALCVEERVVVAAACSAAGAIRLVQVVGGLCDVLRAFGGSDTACETAEFVLEIDLRLSRLTAAGDAVASIGTGRARAQAAVPDWRQGAVVRDDLLGHVVGVADQVRLEVRVEVLGHVAIVRPRRPMLLISPSLVVLAIRVHPGEVVRRDELGGRARVQVRAELVLDLDWHLSHLAQLVGHEFHCLDSLQRQLIVLLILQLDDLLRRASWAGAGASTASSREGALTILFSTW